MRTAALGFLPATRQRGAVAVEFALLSAFFLITLLVGIVEVGRAFFIYNAGTEATRLGARVAVVCDVSASQWSAIRAQMSRHTGGILGAESFAIDYTPAGCGSGKPCRSLTVRVVDGTSFRTAIPFVPLTWSLPPIATTLPTESLDSTGDSRNPVCPL